MADTRAPDLLELAERAWNGELDLQLEHHPVHRYYPGVCRLAKGLLGFKGSRASTWSTAAMVS